MQIYNVKLYYISEIRRKEKYMSDAQTGSMGSEI